MNLVQKLPIGLGLACLMLLSSCSKEDVQTPEPQVGEVNDGSQMRVADGIDVLPQFPHTTGPLGWNKYATNWGRSDSYYSTNLLLLPTGTSSLTYLWGNITMPWVTPLPSPIPAAINPGAILTVSTSTNDVFKKDQRSAVKTKIKHLKSGVKYAITFYVATTAMQGTNGVVPIYAKSVAVVLSHKWATGSHAEMHQVDLTNNKASWVKKTIVFEVYGTTESDFNFSALSPQNGQKTYAHIFVGQNSIKELK